MEITPVAYIYTDFTDKFGIPRQSGRVPELCGRIVFTPEYRSADAIRGIEDFSHLWLIFGFSKAERARPSLTVRPPRLGGNTRIGVFASRSPYRPNSMGLSVVKLQRVEESETQGHVLVVSGVDLLSGTPIYDIKPYIPYADSIPTACGSFADLQQGHALTVEDPNGLLDCLPPDKYDAAKACLRDDPRPSYQNDDRRYSMCFAGFDIRFHVDGDVLTVTEVERKETC